MLGIGIECGFGAAKIEFDHCCAKVMKHLSQVRDTEVVLSIVYVSPSSAIPRDLEDVRVIRLNRKKPVIALAIPVPMEATGWSSAQSYEYIQASTLSAIDFATDKLGDLINVGKLRAMVGDFPVADTE